MSETVEIVALGHGGDGVTADGIFVPHTLPGDIVRITRDGTRGRLEEVLTPSGWRANAPCGHFGRCGGCALQHMAPERYLAWKEELVRTALAQRGFADVPVEPLRSVRAATRRRAMLKARRTDRAVLLGFYEPDSHRLVDIAECPLLVPALTERLPKLRDALLPILKPGDMAELHATATDTGVDLSLKFKRARSAGLLMDLADLASRVELARLSWNGEPVSIARAPRLRVGRYEVELPVEPFLQPTKEGERVLQELVTAAIGSATAIADLFSGLGTFALALADGRQVHAVDHGGPMIAALAGAVRRHKGSVTTETRDLFRRPLLPQELERFGAVVLDPPRPGAKAQAEQLASSRVTRIVYVSCSPASFARDARILTDGGYRLTRVTPVDQFLWSPHLELVASFERLPG